MNGETVEVPEYNFVTGKREYNGKRLQLKNDSVLIIEGIHALNPLLTSGIDDKLKYKIYISALTSISLDDHNWIPTQDNRLLRRIIRDYNKGAYTARETISQWKNPLLGAEELCRVCGGPSPVEVHPLLHPHQRQGNTAHEHHARVRRRQQFQVLK